MTTSRSMVNAELFDAAIGTWTPVATMRVRPIGAHGDAPGRWPRPRRGRVRRLGGAGDGGDLRPGRPGAGRPRARWSRARGYHTATLLPDGRVLVTRRPQQQQQHRARDVLGRALRPERPGPGQDRDEHEPGTGRPTRRRYCPTAGPRRRRRHRWRRVDVADTAELYDPTTGTWTSTGSMTVPRAGQAPCCCPTGEVLVAGGNDSITGAFQVGDWPARCGPPSCTTRPRDLDRDGRHAPTSRIFDGDGSRRRQVLVAGGRVGGHGASSGTSSYDTGGGLRHRRAVRPCDRDMDRGGAAGQRRELQVAVGLPDGRAVIAGGLTAGQALASTEVYDPSANR